MSTLGKFVNRIFTLLLVTGILLSLNAPLPVTAKVNDAPHPDAAVTVNGIVRDGTPSGHTYPLYAEIIFTSPGQTTVTTFSNPFTGAYSASLTQGALYTAAITPTLPGYLAGSSSFTPTSNPFTQNFTVQADLSVFSTPGYSINKVLTETFDLVSPPALPSNWSVTKIGSGSTANWTTSASSAHPSGIQPVSSPIMAVFNSYTAASTHQAMLYMNTPTSLSSLSSAVVSFWMYHDTDYSSSADTIQVAVSTNGTTFYLTGDSPILRYSTTPGWVFHQVDISSYAGSSAVYIGLIGTSGYGNDIHIDDVSISSHIVKLSGGLVSGFVSSAPSGLPIISALVYSTPRPSEQAYSMSRGDDTTLRDGFYQLFSTGTGLQNFTATAIRHLGTAGNITVANDGVTRLDLAPTSAWTTAIPNPVTVTLTVGATGTFPLVISNTGTVTASFTIQPAANALTSGSSSMLADQFPYNEEPATDLLTTLNETAGEDSTPDKPTGEDATPDKPTGVDVPQVTPVPMDHIEIPGGQETHQTNLVPMDSIDVQGGSPRSFGVTTPFPGTAGYRFATASCNGETFYVIGGQTDSTSVNEVWMYDPAGNSWTAKAPLPAPSANMRAACIDGKIYVVGGYNGGVWNNSFNIYDTVANTWTSTTQPVTGAPMVVAYNGLLYAMGGAGPSGALNSANVYNPTSGLWTPLADLPTAASYSGAVVYKDLIFIIGGSDTADVQAYNPVINGWDNSGPDLPGPRMDPVVGWYGDQIVLLNGGGHNGAYWDPYPEGYVLNASAWPGGSWTTFSPTLPKPKVAPASVCAGNRLWSVGGTDLSYEEHITQYYDAGLMCNRTYPAVPWLTVTPQNSTVLAANTRTITLGFNASIAPYNTPGVYHAILKFNSDAPSVMPDIPVTMVVVKTNPALTIAPQSTSKMVTIGKYAAYDFTITNTSGITNSFTVGAYGISPGWTAMLTPPSFTNLPNGGSGILNVKLYPPSTGKIDDEGVVSLYVQVQSDPSKFATMLAIATIQGYKIWLPYVSK